jgi:hypothetical protein
MNIQFMMVKFEIDLLYIYSPGCVSSPVQDVQDIFVLYSVSRLGCSQPSTRLVQYVSNLGHVQSSIGRVQDVHTV